MKTKVTKKLENFLFSKIKNGAFPLGNFYGEIFFAASTKDKKTKKEILKKYLSKDKKIKDFHFEFNNYIIQQMNLDKRKFQTYKFNQPFFKKVTNWILLRALICIKSKNIFRIIWGNTIATLALLINQKNGFLTDNRLYRKKEYSNQYHAFATALLGEIFLETRKKFYKRRFEKAIKRLNKITKSTEIFNRGGRGSSQIFGYSSAICALTLGKKILSIDSQKEINLLVNELKKFQRKDGSIPLCLNEEEFKLKQKDYEKLGNKIAGWESYNRYYDYLGFTLYFLKKI